MFTLISGKGNKINKNDYFFTANFFFQKKFDPAKFASYHYYNHL